MIYFKLVSVRQHGGFSEEVVSLYKDLATGSELNVDQVQSLFKDKLKSLAYQVLKLDITPVGTTTLKDGSKLPGRRELLREEHTYPSMIVLIRFFKALENLKHNTDDLFNFIHNKRNKLNKLMGYCLYDAFTYSQNSTVSPTVRFTKEGLHSIPPKDVTSFLRAYINYLKDNPSNQLSSNQLDRLQQLLLIYKNDVISCSIQDLESRNETFMKDNPDLAILEEDFLERGFLSDYSSPKKHSSTPLTDRVTLLTRQSIDRLPKSDPRRKKLEKEVVDLNATIEALRAHYRDELEGMHQTIVEKTISERNNRERLEVQEIKNTQLVQQANTLMGDYQQLQQKYSDQQNVIETMQQKLDAICLHLTTIQTTAQPAVQPVTAPPVQEGDATITFKGRGYKRKERPQYTVPDETVDYFET